MDENQSLAVKEARLRSALAGLDRVAVAFSGGVDSSYLLAACHNVLGRDKVLAFTADSPLLARLELEMADDIARLLGVEHRVIPFDDLAIPEVVSNSPRRCYYCKKARFEALLALAGEAAGSQLVHGENADDHMDYRPGSAAARELGVRAPLAEAGLTKAEIRILSRRRGLPNWDHPAASCLATRFPTNVALTREGLGRVERAEAFLHRMLGLRQLRVRDHCAMARIEVPAAQVQRLLRDNVRMKVAEGLHALGYRYVTLDIDGYRMGSMNDQIGGS